MIVELKILETIHTAAHDAFAKHINPDDWQKIEAEFQKLLSEYLGEIEIKIK